MKSQKVIHRFFLLFLPFMLTGCYTQFQTFDQFPVEDRGYSSNYSWDEYKQEATSEREYQKEAVDPEAEALERELALQEMDIYFQDYETKRWYEEHYANKLFWEGYDAGYDDGYTDGWVNAGYFPYSARYSFNRHRFLRGYTGAFAYYDFYHYPGFYSSFWYDYGGYYGGGFYAGFYGNQWGYYSPYYNHGYWGNPYYNYHVAYNRYNWSKKYRRDADLYRKGPRNSGLVNRGDYRTRGSNGLKSGNSGDIRTRGTGVTRTRNVNTNTRVRSTNGSSIGRGSSGDVGRSRGSSVGKSRSSGSDNNTRSRGSGSSVGKRSSSGDSGKSRSRGGNNYQSTFGQTSVRDINISDIRSRSYTIPARRVSQTNGRSSSSRSGFFDLFKSTSSDRTNYRSSSLFNSRVRGINSSSRSTNSRSVKSSSSSRSSSKSTNVTRSSSSSRSSGGTKSRSSSSSSKRSRGGN
ncbi:MAG TPA: hypothetical protein DD671_02265 [Balneolaceae bacterium]|nr:hypothetical protein [Balneolaceae bacterium]